MTMREATVDEARVGIARIEELLEIPEDERGFDFGTINRAIEALKQRAAEKRPQISDVRREVMRLMREEFDPTPRYREDRDWNDNAEDVADKVIDLIAAQRPESHQPA